MEEKLFEPSLSQQIRCKRRNCFQGPAVYLVTILPHPPALSHDLLAEAIKKNKPKIVYIKPKRTELCRVFLQEGKVKT